MFLAAVFSEGTAIVSSTSPLTHVFLEGAGASQMYSTYSAVTFYMQEPICSNNHLECGLWVHVFHWHHRPAKWKCLKIMSEQRVNTKFRYQRHYALVREATVSLKSPSDEGF